MSNIIYEDDVLGSPPSDLGPPPPSDLGPPPVVDNSKKTTVVKPKVTYASTPFKTQAEGDAFRAWVNDNYPSYAKEIKLDRSYKSFNNSYIRRAYNDLGNDYKVFLTKKQELVAAEEAKIGYDKQKKIIDDLAANGNIENGVGAKITTKILDSFGKNNYEYAYIKVFSVERDGSGSVTKILDDGKPPVGDPTIYTDDKLVVLFFYDFKWGFLTKGGKINMMGYKLDWSADNPKLSLGESNRKRKLSEQVVVWTNFIGGSQSVIQNTGGSGVGSIYGSSSSGSSSAGAGGGSSSTVIKPPTSRKDELRIMFGFVNPDGTTVKPDVTIKKMNQNEVSGIFGKGSIQRAIDNRGGRSFYFDEFNELMNLENLKDYVLKYPSDFPISEYAGKEIDADNASGLFPLEDEVTSTQLTKETFGNYLGNKSSLDIYINKGQSQTIKSTRIESQYSGECKTKLVDWLVMGLTGDYKSTPNMDELKEMCACYKKGNYDSLIETGLTPEDIQGVSGDIFKKGGIFNKVFSWKEIKKLMQGYEVGGNNLYPQFVDPDFGTNKCLATMSESLSTKIKRKISESIKDKKRNSLKENLTSRILRNIR